MKNQEAEHTKNLTFKEKLLLAQGRLQQNSKIQAPINSKEKISKDQQDMGQNVKCMSLQSNTNAKNKNEADGLTFKDKLRFAQLNSESSNKIEKNEIKEKPQEIPVPKNKKEIENNEIESQEKKLDITKNIAKEEIKKEDQYSNVENKTINRPNGLSFQEKLRLAQSYSQSEQNNQSTKLSTPGDIMKADNCVISDSKKEIQSFQEEPKNDSKQNRKSSVQNDSKNGTANMSFKEKIKFAQDYSQSNLNAQRKDSKEINRTEEQVESKIFEKNEIKNPNNDDISLTNSEIKQKSEAKEISFKEKLKFAQEFAKPCQEIGQTEKFSTINEKKKEQDIQKYSSVDKKAQIENIASKEINNKETLSSGFKEKLRLAQERAQNSVQEPQKNINLTQKDEKMKEPKEIKTSDSNLNKENSFDIKTREDDKGQKSNINKKEISQQWNSILSTIQLKKPSSQEISKPSQEFGQTEKFSTINEKKKEQDIQKYSSVDKKAQIENIASKEINNKETLSSGFKEKLRLAQERAQNSVQEPQKNINLTQKDEKMKEPKEIKTSDSNLNKENSFDIKTREDDKGQKSNINKKEISQQWNSILSTIQLKKPSSQEISKPSQEFGQTEKFSTINEKKKEQDIQKYSSVDKKAQIENIASKEINNKETLSSGFKEKLRLAQERAQNSVQEPQKNINLTQKDEKMKEPKEIKTSDSNLNKENAFDMRASENDNNKKSNISKKEISQQWNSILSAIQQKKPISQTNSTSKEEKEKIVPNEMNLNRNSSLNTIKTQTEIKGQTLDANRAQSKNDLIKEKNDLVEDNNMQAIQIDLVNNKDVHKKLVEIQSNINDSTVMMDKKHIYVIKNSFESFLNSIIFEAVVENIKNGQQSMIPELYKAKIQSLSETIHFLVSIVDEIYDDKYKDISEEEETNDKAEIMANTTLYVMSEKQSFKEITIDITSESDLNSKIPQDF